MACPMQARRDGEAMRIDISDFSFVIGEFFVVITNAAKPGPPDQIQVPRDIFMHFCDAAYRYEGSATTRRRIEN